MTALGDWIMGTAADWASVGVNAVLAIATIFGLRRAIRDARAAENRAERAEAELADDRQRQQLARRALHDLQLLDAVVRMHHAAHPNVALTPAQVGELRGALDLLGADCLPRTRARYFKEATDFDVPGNPMLRFLDDGREDASVELRDEVQRLRTFLI